MEFGEDFQLMYCDSVGGANSTLQIRGICLPRLPVSNYVMGPHVGIEHIAQSNNLATDIELDNDVMPAL